MNRIHILVIFFFLFSFSNAHSAEKLIYDGTLYIKKPDLEKCGFLSTYTVYEHFVFDIKDAKKRSKEQLPNIDLIREQIQASKNNELIILDIESWPVTFYRRHKSVIDISKHNYLTTLQHFREEGPNKKFGYFGVVPTHSPKALVSNDGEPQYEEMQEDNDNLNELANEVDVIFPIGYTFSRNVEDWKKAVATQINEARRLAPQKKVIVYLWPQYADYGLIDKSLKLKWIEASFWRTQIEFSLANADGIIVWGGWNGKKMPWNRNASWWKILKEYLPNATYVKYSGNC
ncbi:hypothetical protein IVG45_18080 [Methylomonas sp. LL1]|uniref:hypothetical protein n=1 Tax=Methylomonas sp. LL1 TaxID=2785785 RepID=UPI0018C445EC|nr:hypothetical protein [Methylomonas sp. LL1]QPK62724.1 hypothetical protein IVG45_18080 [Methylomonas sp. LL1]